MKLLHDDEVPAWDTVNAEGNNRLVLVCDHAAHTVPRRLMNLGLTEAKLQEHIGWDAGAADLARNLSQRLHAPLVLSNYSRLVIDCNRSPGNRESIPEQSDGNTIPGNTGLSQQQRLERELEFFRPYHDAIAGLLDARMEARPVLVAIHSFTPMLGRKLRPWSIGVCYGTDSRLAGILLPILRTMLDSGIGDNQPYAIEKNVDYTLPRHATSRNLNHVMLEVSRDQLHTAASVERWGERLALAWQEAQALLP